MAGPQSFLIFKDLTLLKSTGQLFSRMSLIWVCLVSCLDESEITHCREGYHRSGVPFSALQMKGHMSVCITGDAMIT